jgi:hypothetical protein
MNVIDPRREIIIGITDEKLNTILGALMCYGRHGGLFGDKKKKELAPCDIERQEKSLEITDELIAEIEIVLSSRYHDREATKSND